MTNAAAETSALFTSGYSTETTFSTSYNESRPFVAKYAGRCAWTGAQIYPGDSVRMYGEGVVKRDAVMRWDFRMTSAQPGAAYGEHVSRFERVSDLDAALAKCLAGREVEVIAGNGYITYSFEVRDGRFRAAAGKADKSVAQMRALLSKASAFCVRI